VQTHLGENGFDGRRFFPGGKQVPHVTRGVGPAYSAPPEGPYGLEDAWHPTTVIFNAGCSADQQPRHGVGPWLLHAMPLEPRCITEGGGTRSVLERHQNHAYGNGEESKNKISKLCESSGDLNGTLILVHFSLGGAFARIAHCSGTP